MPKILVILVILCFCLPEWEVTWLWGLLLLTAPIILSFTPALPTCRGEAVWMLQARLRELGYGVVPNGQYDASTRAVSMYQVANGFEENATVTQPI